MINYVYPASSVTIDTSGLATAANQVIMISELQDINTELDSQTALLTDIEANQAAQTAELVDINAELDIQTPILTDIEANQAAQTTELQSINTELDTQTGILNSIEANTADLDVVDFLDTPLLLAASTNIPASASTPLTVVASLAANVKKVFLADTTGESIGIYSDPAGTPVLELIINPGSDSVIPLLLSAGTTVGVRNMRNAAIAEGDLCIQFLG